MVERLFLAVPLGCLRFVIVVFHDNHLLFFIPYLNFILSYEIRLNVFYPSFMNDYAAMHCNADLRFYAVFNVDSR